MREVVQEKVNFCDCVSSCWGLAGGNFLCVIIFRKKEKVDSDKERLYNSPNAQRPTPNAQRPTPNVYACPKSEETIHVVLAVYDPSGNYSQHAGVVMTSIFENTKSKIIIHLLHDDTLTEDNRKKFIRTAKKYSQNLDFIDVTSYKNKTSERANKLLGYLTIGTLYRLCLPDVLDISRIIYLDCDIVVNLDILELWNVNEENYCLAGVHSSGYEIPTEALRDKLCGSNNMLYVNAGVLIMNLEQIRKSCNLFTASLDWIKRNGSLMTMGDQDVLNSLFCGKIKLIDGKFNNFNPLKEEQIHNTIIHTPTSNYSQKTWGMIGLPSQKLYWKYYARSAWGENKSFDELFDVLVPVVQKSFEPKHTFKQCLQRVIVSTLRKPFHSCLAEMIKLIFLYASSRVKQCFSH